MRNTYFRSCIVAFVAAMVLSGCSTHCSCPAPTNTQPSTTIVTPRD